MKLLVLGGSHFVGRTIVEAGMSLGYETATLNRGLTGATGVGVELLRADRTNRDELADAIGQRTWDAVIDTWHGPPVHAATAASLLGPRVGHYSYVSSRSVYSWPIAPGADETHSVIDGDAADENDADYARAKRGSELGVLSARPDALIARPGLILGPYEDVGRLPWWLHRLERGGRVLAPGPESRPLQYIDARDLAEWMLRCVDAHKGGIYNTVSPAGHTTMGALLAAAMQATDSDAELVWLTPEEIASAAIEPWTELPIWLPPTGPMAGLHNGDVSAAIGAGLRCRSIAETVDDTWRWLQDEGMPPQREDRPAPGLDALRESEVIRHHTHRAWEPDVPKR